MLGSRIIETKEDLSILVRKCAAKRNKGKAIVSVPKTAHIAPKNFPIGVVGTLSPYPTVQMVMIAHQNVSGILVKLLSSSSFNSTKKTALDPQLTAVLPNVTKSPMSFIPEATVSTKIRIASE